MNKSRQKPLTPIDRARRIFREAGGTLRAGQARKAGVHPRTLRTMLDETTIERIGHGLYRLTDAPPISSPDLVSVAMQCPRAVVCLISALSFHELTSQIPHRVDIALPPGARSPKIEYPPIQVYRFSGPSLTEGLETHQQDGVNIRVFGAAKTIADCFKFRHKIGLDIALESLQSYCRRRGSNLDSLLRFADINRVRNIMMPYLEATL